MQAVLFDVDDTLYDLSAPFFEAYRTFFVPKYDVSAEQIYPVSRKYSNAAYPLALAGKITMREVYLSRIRDAFAEFGVRVSEKEALDFQELYAARQHEISLSETMHEILRYCAPRAALGIITNGMSAQQWGKIQSLQAERYIPRDHIFVSRDVGIEKPDPGIFRCAAQRMGLTAADSICYVGDSYECDVAGALAAGWKSVWMNRHHRRKPQGMPEPDYRAESEQELFLVLKSIL